MVNDFIKYEAPILTAEEMLEKSRSFFFNMNQRRSIREFSEKPVSKEVIENIIKTASTSPSGAHKQPWTFCIITNPTIKKQIRIAAEKEEKESYDHRMSDEWLRDLEKFATNWQKPFIETAPYIIVIFKKIYDVEEDGTKHTNYYVQESVGIAAGMLITAIHQAGLVTLTHTPSPMNFLNKILDRPANEKPFLLLPVGFPADDARVPDIERKKLDKISVWY
ncbi:MAG: nitroreductase family protein [Bacteroidetes bacterium]|nr:nitroreductase family protein [Bacteroidota bacterium]MBU1485095.1 nitroreductase family protein [Bacteroidota bacterium]MBU2267956.1 nitroreductase family protein [Bacteroidota bacterium]MBU2376448.1 nitroreductase family protein [Bacteroidota bacterium]